MNSRRTITSHVKLVTKPPESPALLVLTDIETDKTDINRHRNRLDGLLKLSVHLLKTSLLGHKHYQPPYKDYYSHAITLMIKPLTKC